MFGNSRSHRARTLTTSTSTRRARRNPSVRVPALRRTKPTFSQRVKAAFARPASAGRSSHRGARHVTLVRRGHRTHTTVVPSRSKPTLAARIKRLFSIPLSRNAKRSTMRRRMRA